MLDTFDASVIHFWFFDLLCSTCLMCHMIFFNSINFITFVSFLSFLFQEIFSSCQNDILIIFLWLSSFLWKMFKCHLLVIVALDKESSVSFLISSTNAVNVFVWKNCACYFLIFWSWMSHDCLKLMKRLKKNRLLFLMKNSTCLKLFKLLRSRNISYIIILNFFMIMMIN